MVELLFSHLIHIKACIVMRQIITLKKSDEQMSSLLIWLLLLLFSKPNIFPLVAKKQIALQPPPIRNKFRLYQSDPLLKLQFCKTVQYGCGKIVSAAVLKNSKFLK
jgi:hypothetical protein